MSNYYYDHQNSHQHDAYAMQNYPSYHAKLEQPDGYYQSPQPLLYNEFSSSEKFSRANNRPRSCCDRICCGCCTCCPRWCRWISCILLLLIIGLAIAIGVLAALFKEPSVEFTGIQGQPAFGLEGTTANLNISLGFTVKNPNIESVTFKTLTATANYHGDTTQLGTGTLNDLHIGSNSITNISFPFNISLNLLASETQTVVTKLMSDCGLSGGTAKDIQLDYKVVATVSIIGIPISIPFSSSASFKCPIDSSQSSILNDIAGLLGASGNNVMGAIAGALPSNIASYIPTGTSIPTQYTSLIPTQYASMIPTQYASLIPSGL